MQESLKATSNNKNSPLLDTVETVSVLGSIGGAIASVVYQQVAIAAIPLSVTLALNLANRRRLIDSVNHNNQTAIAQLVQEDVTTHTKLEMLTEQLAEVQQLSTAVSQVNSNLQDYNQTLQSNQTAITQLTQENLENQNQLETLTQQLTEIQQLTTEVNQVKSELQEYNQVVQGNQTAIAQLTQENAATHNKLGTLTQQLSEIKRLTNNLNQSTNKLQIHSQSLGKEQTKLANSVSYLREIDICTQNVRLNSNDATSYYNRGIIYQNLGYKQTAILDHTEAIRLNPRYAAAYHARGLTRAYLGDKKGAVADLREAAKLFFDRGDIANYQIAKTDLNKQFPDLTSKPKTDTFVEEVEAVEYLFA